MSAQNDVEMQYQSSTETMDAAKAPSDSANKNESTETEPKKRTFLGMRGGGIILDMCACFICCECMEGCCNCIDDCCCC